MQSVAKAKPKAKAKPEDLEPQTLQEIGSNMLPELLASASKARTLSIKLSKIEYASQLKDQLLKHALKMEVHYQHLQTALEEKHPDKQLRRLLDEVQKASCFGDKAEAGFFVGWLVVDIFPTI